MASRIPVLRSGTALEVAELSWIAEGVTRELALSIPSVLACRNLIAGTVLQLPLFRYRGGDRLDPGYLLTKPDPSTTMPATIGGTVDDLLFRGRAYWRVLDRDAEGFVTRARWTPVDDVTPEARSTGGAYSILTGYTRRRRRRHASRRRTSSASTPASRASSTSAAGRSPRRSSSSRPRAASPRSSSPPASSRTRAPSSPPTSSSRPRRSSPRSVASSASPRSRAGSTSAPTSLRATSSSSRRARTSRPTSAGSSASRSR